MRRFYRVAGFVLALAVLAYFIYYLLGAFDSSKLVQLFTIRAMAAMLIATILYGLIIPSSAWAWRRLLADGTREWVLPQLMGIMGVTQIAKYLPGNIAQHASRAALSVSRGMGMGRFLMSTIVETMLALLAALLVGLACLGVVLDGRAGLTEKVVGPALWGLATIALLLSILPRLVGWGARLFAKLNRRPSESWSFAVPRSRAQIEALLAYAANYLLIGIGFLFIARAVGVGPEIGYAQLTAAFALSWLAGFIAPGMPAGLGVREGVMAMVLDSPSDSGGVVLAIIAMRISTMAADLGWFFLGGALLARFKTKGVT